MRKKTVLGVTLSKIISLVMFLLVLWALNTVNLENSTAVQVIEFLNINLSIIIIMSFIFYLAELFYVFNFPLNIPGPIFNGIGAVILVEFIFQIFRTMGQVTKQYAIFGLKSVSVLVFILVFLIVVILGYVNIFLRLHPEESETIDSKKKPKHKDSTNRKKHEDLEWEDVGNELKLAAYYLAKSIKEYFQVNKK
ncbi:hypothetical protein K9M79_01190 [Candidatus Woesearchaeota archaeon]|nr:hypothetical protein [Candidatus Woesearchaeota archaeon]